MISASCRPHLETLQVFGRAVHVHVVESVNAVPVWRGASPQPPSPACTTPHRVLKFVVEVRVAVEGINTHTRRLISTPPNLILGTCTMDAWAGLGRSVLLRRKQSARLQKSTAE
jgi:hypothetical protein